MQQDLKDEKYPAVFNDFVFILDRGIAHPFSLKDLSFIFIYIICKYFKRTQSYLRKYNVCFKYICVGMQEQHKFQRHI